MTRVRSRLTAPALPRQMPSFSILIADQDDDFRDLVRRHLGPAAMVVGDVADGDEAVRLAKRLRPDIVLIDSAMALCGGMEAARRIKKDRAETKVVLLTSGDEPWAPPAGADDAVLSVHVDGLVKKQKVRTAVPGRRGRRRPVRR
jgi:CheY-like chemotaxis protein